MKKIYLSLLFLLILSSGLCAQEITVKTQAPGSAVLGESFRVTYTVDTELQDGSPAIDKPDGFEVITGPHLSTSQSSTVVNGKNTTAKSTGYSYVLQANRAGTHSLPRLGLTLDGKKYRSDPITIEIVSTDNDTSGNASQGVAQSQGATNRTDGSGDSFMQIQLSSKQVEVGEKITVVIKFYTTEDFREMEKIKLPYFDGFLIEQVDLPRDRTWKKEQHKGRNYNTVIIDKYLVSPLYAGILTIDPCVFSYKVVIREPGGTGNMFDDFFGANHRIESRTISSGSVKIEAMRAAPMVVGDFVTADFQETGVEAMETIQAGSGQNDEASGTATVTDYKEILFYASIALLTLILVVYISRLSSRRNRQERYQHRDDKQRTGQSLAWQVPFVLAVAALGLVVFLLFPGKSDMQMPDVPQMQALQIPAETPINIFYTLDVSTTMDAEDMKPDRLHATKQAIMELHSGINDFHQGLTFFAAESRVVSSLSGSDFLGVLNGIDSLDIDREGTAIGSGLAFSINELKERPDERNYILLFTDGLNNSGNISPRSAGQLAQALGIRLYIIGIGADGKAPIRIVDASGKKIMHHIETDIDEDLLTDIATSTGGEYYRVKDTKELASACEAVGLHIAENIGSKPGPPAGLPFEKAEAPGILETVMADAVLGGCREK